MKKGKLIIIVAPSGTGKSTLIEKALKEFPLLNPSISFTTRPPREGEIEGEDYFFITEEEFVKRREAGGFLEWARVHSNYYGTSKDFVEKTLEKGEHLLFDLDVQGADSMKSYFKQTAKAIFIEPPSLKVLEERLLKRGTEKAEVIKERLANAESELKRKDDYDFLVVNNNFEEAHKNLSSTIRRILEE